VPQSSLLKQKSNLYIKRDSRTITCNCTVCMTVAYCSSNNQTVKSKFVFGEMWIQSELHISVFCIHGLNQLKSQGNGKYSEEKILHLYWTCTEFSLPLFLKQHSIITIYTAFTCIRYCKSSKGDLNYMEDVLVLCANISMPSYRRDLSILDFGIWGGS
jgi:hypothetical protein